MADQSADRESLDGICGLTFNAASRNLVALSEWIDAGNAERDPEAVTWGRLAKITEEAGEVIAAFIGYTGQNPRKGKTHIRHEVIDELLDVAITALGAAEHMSGHQGLVLAALAEKIERVAKRAGLNATPVPASIGCSHPGLHYTPNAGLTCAFCGASHPTERLNPPVQTRPDTPDVNADGACT